jgi:hypothetical protein
MKSFLSRFGALVRFVLSDSIVSGFAASRGCSTTTAASAATAIDGTSVSSIFRITPKR